MTRNTTVRNFRTDINGLRAIAVTSVVLFHFGILGFTGGFVGVDIFFVISGFLMTGIIVKGLENKNFSFRSFYLARARRIIPALVFLCLVLLLLGWFYLSPNEYSRLAKEADRAILFLSNDYFYKKTGYFEPNAHERLLLHTWSLSVEWQFYIIYPIILYVVARFKLDYLFKFIVFAFLSSFTFSVIKSYENPSFAFYQLSTRAWEMLLGGIVFFLSRKPVTKINTKACYYLGMVLIVLSIALFSANTIWPGIAALLPTVGTALIIYANQNNLITNNKLFQKLGDWSYSIYLWHWPLAVIIVIFDVNNVFINLSFVLLSILLGACSYYIIEGPIRKALTKYSNALSFITLFFVLALMLGFANYIRKNDGLSNRLPEQALRVFEQSNNKFMEMERCHKAREDSKDCRYGQGELAAIVIGDSHAMSLVGTVSEVLIQQQVLDWTKSACPTIAGVKTTGSESAACNQFWSDRIPQLKQYFGVPVILTNRFSAHLIGYNEQTGEDLKTPTLYLTQPYRDFTHAYTEEIYQGYLDTLCKIAETNPLYIVKPTPELKLNVPETMGRFALIGEYKRVSIELAEYQARNKIALQLLEQASGQCGVTLLDPTPYLCDQQNCYGDVEGLPIYYDDDHLNMRGSDLLKPLFQQHFSK